MDVQQYISSGIIETYVLGMASEEEVRELMMLCEQYPEIKEALLSVQADMEQYATLHAAQPPSGMKEQIWNVLQENNNINSDSPADSSIVSNVIAFKEPEKEKKAFRSMMAAAAVIVIIASVGLNFFFWNKTQSTQQELASMKTEQQQMLASNKAYQEKLAQINSMLLDPAMKSMVLAGVGNHVGTNAMLLWNTSSKEVYLSLKNMPPPPTGKQYQLWAIVDGKPVDAGVYALDSKDDMQKMKVIPSAQMFAITIENEGGSAAPTLDQMVVAGKV
ncbi:anti-sigma factor [Taibaiella lutea]|uniref:Anti-sigma factor n=1 Tax=Taibaiella lutea TaxID=2608001 RepID=A0A5M6CHE3_9BACT|nr:anti-sigma factor [Taibaiella lutea]KAA5534628.1 anti-sigma factor [Taibaiella lutea]